MDNREWNPELREAAKAKATRWGWLMIVGGFAITGGIVWLDRTVTLWLFALPALMIVLGAIAAVPDVFTPLAYRTLDEIDGRRQGPPE